MSEAFLFPGTKLLPSNAWSVARAFNPRAEDSMHNLEGLVTAAPQATAGQPQPLLGPVPPNFPATVGAFRELQSEFASEYICIYVHLLMSSTDNVVSRLLNAYHLDTSGNIAAKRRRMAHHIGVIP